MRLIFKLSRQALKNFLFFKDDVFLGMQAMNVGVVDQIITQYEYELLSEYNKIDKTPDSTIAVSALSQMWIYAVYEVLRMWRDRKYEFEKLYENGGIDSKVADMPDEPENQTITARRKQMKRFQDDAEYREQINSVWNKMEKIYRATELIRINLAKHCAPGKKNIIPMSPGYARINDWCGALDYQLIEKNKDYPMISSNSYYTCLNRRDIADTLRKFLIEYA